MRRKTKVVRAAVEYAQKQGYDPAEYEVVSVVREQENHVVFFQGKSGLPGDHFSVLVSRSTGQAIALQPGE